MRHVLNLHPDSSCAALAGIEVEATRSGSGLLVLRYVATGATGDLSLPSLTAPCRADGLWRHTCFEAFVRGPQGEAYHEFNLAPSGQWAAYRFDGYRQGMRPAEGLDAPRIEVRSTESSFELHASLDLAQTPDLGPGTPWRMGLSAVIEEVGGRTSYWALAHPPGKADFHHANCFAFELPATGLP